MMPWNLDKNILYCQYFVNFFNTWPQNLPTQSTGSNNFDYKIFKFTFESWMH